MRAYLLVFAFLCSAWPMPAQNSPSDDPDFQRQIHTGREALGSGRYAEALNTFKELNKRQNDSCAPCYINMALAYLRMGKFEDAMKSCDRAVSVAGNEQLKAAAHSMKGTVLLSLAQPNIKNLKDAEAEYRAATELDKTEPIFHLNLATALLRESNDSAAKAELSQCLSLHPTESVAEKANQLIANPALGRANLAPDFRLTTLQGRDISLKDLHGDVVVLDFWATWCPPCRDSVSELKELTRKYANAKIVVISISGDEDEKAWRDFVTKKKMDWPQYRDSKGALMQAFAVRAFPTYLVIDGDGVIKERITGANPQESIVHRLRATLQAIPQLETAAAK